MKDAGQNVSILMSKNGITGTSGNDGAGVIRNSYSSGVKIYVLTEENLLQIADGRNLFDILSELNNGFIKST